MRSRLVSTFSFVILTIVFAGAGHAEEQAERRQQQKYYQPGAGYAQEPEYSFEGVIMRLPEAGLFGIWTVDSRQIVVSPDTRINEEHGKAAAGAQIKVKGVLKKGIHFMATEVEISKGSGS